MTIGARTNQLGVKLAAVLGSSILSAFLIGFLLGKWRSPKYEDPTQSPRLLQIIVGQKANVRQPLTYRKEYYPDGRLKSLEPEDLKYDFTCADRIFEYDVSKDSVNPLPNDAATTDVVIPRHEIDVKEMFEIVFGGASAYAIPETANKILDYERNGTRDTLDQSESAVHAEPEATEPEPKVHVPTNGPIAIGAAIVAIVAAVPISVYLGFRIGYSEELKCGEPLFQKELNDPVFWKGIANRSAPYEKWYLHYRDKVALPDVYHSLTEPQVFSLTEPRVSSAEPYFWMVPIVDPDCADALTNFQIGVYRNLKRQSPKLSKILQRSSRPPDGSDRDQMMCLTRALLDAHEDPLAQEIASAYIREANDERQLAPVLGNGLACEALGLDGKQKQAYDLGFIRPVKRVDIYMIREWVSNPANALRCADRWGDYE